MQYKVVKTDTNLLWGRVTRILVVFCLLIILYVTIFPFDFDRFLTNSVWFSRIDWRPIRLDDHWDIVRNILLFIPFGFGLASNLSFRGINRRTIFLLVIGTAGLLSLGMELIQLWLPHRDSSLGDLLTNVGGALVGYLLFLYRGAIIERWAISWFIHLQNRLGLGHLLAIMVFYILFLVLGIAWLQKKNNLSNWSNEFKLAIANEIKVDRQWYGEIDQVILLNRAFSLGEIACYFENDCTVEEFNPSLLAYYKPTSNGRWVDQTGQEPDLISASKGKGKTCEEGDTTTISSCVGAQWFKSTQPVSKLSTELRNTSEFSLILDATSERMEQFGPARIFTISDGPYRRNLTVGQENDSLVIRIRTPLAGSNGMLPEFVIPDFWIEDKPSLLVITFNGTKLMVFVDSVDEVYSFDYSPHITLFNYLIPGVRWQVHPGKTSQLIYTFFFCAFLLGPLALLLVAIYRYGLKRNLPLQGVFLLLVLLPFLLEIMIAMKNNQGLVIENIVLGSCVMLLTVGLGR